MTVFSIALIWNACKKSEKLSIREIFKKDAYRIVRHRMKVLFITDSQVSSAFVFVDFMCLKLAVVPTTTCTATTACLK